jgi:hypothetical protein
VSPGKANLRLRSEMKYALRRMVSSETSPEIAGSAGGDIEMCAVVPAIVSFPDVTLRGFLAVLARRPLWRLSVFFGGAGASDVEDACFLSSALFVFLGTVDQWLNGYDSFIVHRFVGKCFLALVYEIG